MTLSNYAYNYYFSFMSHARFLIMRRTHTCTFVYWQFSWLFYFRINSFAASRSLLAVGAVPAPNKNRTGTLYKIDNCTLVYTRGLSLKFFDGKNDELYNFDNDEPKVSGKCNNSAKGPSESVLNVNYTGLKGNITEFKMKWVTYWYIFFMSF